VFKKTGMVSHNTDVRRHPDGLRDLEQVFSFWDKGAPNGDWTMVQKVTMWA
jgi:hypothetical protein